MFITLTIDTNKKRKNCRIRFSKRKINAVQGWSNKMKIKKRSIIQKLQSLKKSWRQKHYKMNGQIVAL